MWFKLSFKPVRVKLVLVTRMKTKIYKLCDRYGGALQNLTLKLPVTINKFFQPTEMASQDFFQRWKQLSQ